MARAGRPLKFKDPKELEDQINQYFAEREKQKLPFTITGLALALDTSRQTLGEYETFEKGDIDEVNEADKKKIISLIQRAKMRCEDYAEIQLFMSKNQAGAIFSLKNFGWKDKSEINGNFVTHNRDAGESTEEEQEAIKQALLASIPPEGGEE